MIRKAAILPLAATLILGLAAVTPAVAQIPIEVSITNLTRGQIISNPLVISHGPAFSLFELGMPASPELAIQAEDGDPGPLTGVLATLPSVLDFEVAASGIMPGETVTVALDSRRGFAEVTVSGMLVTTNDALVAVRGLEFTGQGTSAMALAYDAGSEGNAELCDHIPGPPCFNGGVRNPTGAEGYVHVHAGVHGIGDLAAEDFDWRNPVARVTIRRSR